MKARPMVRKASTLARELDANSVENVNPKSKIAIVATISMPQRPRRSASSAEIGIVIANASTPTIWRVRNSLRV